MIKKVSILTLSLLASVVYSQPSPPPAPMDPVSVNKRFVKLIKGEVVNNEVKQASEDIVCTVAPPDPSTIPFGATFQYYEWSDVGPSGTAHTNEPTYTGKLYGAGEHYVGCRAVYITAGSTLPTYIHPCKSKVLYVVGGPLSLGVGGGIANVPSADDAGYLYLQYFGYNPAGTIPYKAQPVQVGTLTAAGGQPGTITYTWTVPSGLVQTSQGATSQIQVGATGGSAGSAVSVAGCLTYHFTNNNPQDLVTGDVIDDSKATPDVETRKVEKKNHSFIAHAPSYIMFGTDNVNTDSSATLTHQLYDDGNVTMPAVYIAERTLARGTVADSYSSITTKESGFFTQQLVYGGTLPYGSPSPYRDFICKYFGGNSDTSSLATTGISLGVKWVCIWSDGWYLDNLPVQP